MGNFLPTFQLQKHIWTTLVLEHKFTSQSTTSMSTQMCKFIVKTSIKVLFALYDPNVFFWGQFATSICDYKTIATNINN
jgi:hypothetical protein